MPKTYGDHITTYHGPSSYGGRTSLGRRALFAGAATLAAAPAASVATAGANPDVDLIVRCHDFAARDIEFWYRRELDGQDVPDEAWPGHDAERAALAAAAAASPAGWRAKALVLTTALHDVRGNLLVEDEAGLAASLLRDMAGPARATILADLAARMGPLPASDAALA